MADIHIERNHALAFAQARKVAFQWAEKAEEKFDMECTYEEGKGEDDEDVLTFTRSGVKGTLVVTKDQFVLNAKLGFLLGAFKESIEGEIVKNFDTLLAIPAKKPAVAKKASTVKKT